MGVIKIDNSNVISKFETHLADINNKRILVTAPFGAGKSYFLKEFFSGHERYLPITLYPVDYSVNTNEDIFELIKYDIIDALMVSYPGKLQLSSNDLSNLLLGQQFLTKEINLIPLIKSIAQTQSIPLDQLFEVFESAKELIQKFKNYKEKMNANETKLLKDFMEPFETKRGSAREYDGVTQFIVELLLRLKSSEEVVPEKPMQTILIIDDLDRLDPDQIFRLFNIFSAHHDSREDSNKFGFDKVIFVCDLINIEHMFRHRYGRKANFDGYIDKFYSYMPFIFNHKAFLKQKSKEYLLRNNYDDEELGKYHIAAIDDRFYGQKTMFFEALSSLVDEMIDKSLLRTRNFQKFRIYELSEKESHIGHRSYPNKHLPLIILASMMIQFFPRMADLIDAIDELAEQFPANYEVKQKIGRQNYQAQLLSYSIPFLLDDYSEMSYGHSREDDYLVDIKNEHDEKVFIVYNASDYNNFGFLELIYSKTVKDGELVNKRCAQSGLVNPNYYYFLSQALKNCVKKGYL